MRLFLGLVVVGLGLTLSGFAVLFGSIGGWVPIELGFVGLALGLAVGPLTFLGGLAAYALRRPTPTDLALQKPGDYRTWHFRPTGLLLLVVVVSGLVALGNWAESRRPGINSGQRPLTVYVFAIACVAALSVRNVRNVVFYTKETAETNDAGTPLPDTAADRPRG
jgi:hypothetical protein